MTTFQLGFKCPPPPKGEEYARQELVAEIAAEILFGQSSELYLWLYEDGLIDSSFGGGSEFVAGTAMLTCGGDSIDPEEVRDCILREAAHLVKHGIDQSQFERTKKSFMGIRVKNLTGFDGTCFRLLAYHMEDYDYFRFPELFDQITAEDIRLFLERNVRPENCALSIVDPTHSVG